VKAFIYSASNSAIVGEVFVGDKLLQKLAEKQITKEQLHQMVEKDFTLLSQVLSGVSSSKADIRYGCANVLMDLSARHPEKLYPHMEAFVALLDSKYRILVWNALAIIANLCVVDADKKFDALFDKYYSFLGDPYMVTVANTVGNSGRIALAKPYLIPRITNELLKVEGISATPHLTDECKRVIAEQTVETFNVFFYKMNAEEKAKALKFVKRQLGSSREKLNAKAELFIKKWANTP
jgi:hypothetical protein